MIINNKQSYERGQREKETDVERETERRKDRRTDIQTDWQRDRGSERENETDTTKDMEIVTLEIQRKRPKMKCFLGAYT